MEKLLAFLEAIYPLSPELREHLILVLKSRQFERREFLLKKGQTARNIYFIEEGLVRCYYMLADRDISSWFMKEGDVVVSVKSFFGQSPSAEYIQALEDCSVYYMSFEELEATYEKFLPFNITGRKILTHYYRLSEERAASMRSLKAKERFAFLLEHQPELLQRVPRKYLASYLGVTEATLSNTNGKPIIHLKLPV